jgi:Tfp pilus assembly protein PilO
MRLRELAMLVLLLMIPVASYFLVFVPQNTAIDEAKGEIRHKQEMLDQLQRETARNSSLAEANERIAEQISEIENRLPSDKEVDRVVRHVSKLAIQAGLEPPSVKSGKPISAALYMEQPLEMKTAGNFTGLYAFLQTLERLPRITRLPEMQIRRRPTDDGIVDVTFTLSIFFQQEPQA